MKRILAWILIMVLFVGCAGCKEKETEKETETEVKKNVYAIAAVDFEGEE